MIKSPDLLVFFGKTNPSGRSRSATPPTHLTTSNYHSTAPSTTFQQIEIHSLDVTSVEDWSMRATNYFIYMKKPVPWQKQKITKDSSRLDDESARVRQWYEQYYLERKTRKRKKRITAREEVQWSARIATADRVETLIWWLSWDFCSTTLFDDSRWCQLRVTFDVCHLLTRKTWWHAWSFDDLVCIDT
jgi:hypothetical protein